MTAGHEVLEEHRLYPARDQGRLVGDEGVRVQLELTILMPCLNEERTLPECIEKAYASLHRLGIEGEVVVADNGSTDRSVEVAQSYGARVVHVKERGYGAALLSGIHAANGKYVIMGDADCSYDFGAIEAFLAKLRSGVQLVCGNRFQGGIESGAMPLLHRYLGNPVLSFLGRLFYRIKIGDFHCGIRGFDREAIRGLKLGCTGMEFASEMIVKAAKYNLVIDEVPAKLYVDKRDRKPHLRTWRDGWRHLKFLLTLAPKVAFLIPGVSFLLVGLMVIVNSLSGTGLFFLSTKITPGIHAMLYSAAMVIVGVELLFMYLVSSDLSAYSGFPRRFEFRSHVESWFEWLFGGGLLLVISGVLLGIGPVATWVGVGFGSLEPEQVMRQAIPAVLSLVVGVLVMANTLLLSAISYLLTGGEKQHAVGG